MYLFWISGLTHYPVGCSAFAVFAGYPDSDRLSVVPISRKTEPKIVTATNHDMVYPSLSRFDQIVTSENRFNQQLLSHHSQLSATFSVKHNFLS